MLELWKSFLAKLKDHALDKVVVLAFALLVGGALYLWSISRDYIVTSFYNLTPEQELHLFKIVETKYEYGILHHSSYYSTIDGFHYVAIALKLETDKFPRNPPHFSDLTVSNVDFYDEAFIILLKTKGGVIFDRTTLVTATSHNLRDIITLQGMTFQQVLPKGQKELIIELSHAGGKFEGSSIHAFDLKGIALANCSNESAGYLGSPEDVQPFPWSRSYHRGQLEEKLEASLSTWFSENCEMAGEYSEYQIHKN